MTLRLFAPVVRASEHGQYHVSHMRGTGIVSGYSYKSPLADFAGMETPAIEKHLRKKSPKIFGQLKECEE